MLNERLFMQLHCPKHCKCYQRLQVLEGAGVIGETDFIGRNKNDFFVNETQITNVEGFIYRSLLQLFHLEKIIVVKIMFCTALISVHKMNFLCNEINSSYNLLIYVSRQVSVSVIYHFIFHLNKDKMFRTCTQNPI